ncbi:MULTISPECIES: hypothetical protein [unclassified Rhizobium]|uniref:hypothetical protein n=1 Tax=unclassified Rhizobium TaxID=2613769 RepID=UPI002478466F|nr:MULTISPECIES: hypothetical protein [unclassified Rhizobium]MDH7804543.1 hypothetical protein [Rhizobium sp. AN70]
MVSNLIAWLFATFAIGPLQAEFEQYAAAANLPLEIVQQSRTCLSSQVPLLVQRASEDSFWTISTIVGISTGRSNPADLLDKDNPACAAVIGLFEDKAADAT